jgi:hypothetical protein
MEKRKQTAGTGTASKYMQSGDIGADTVESRNPPDQHEEPRSGFTRKVFSSPCGPRSDFADHCAGGNKQRFEELLRSPGPDMKPDDWDALPGQSGK